MFDKNTIFPKMEHEYKKNKHILENLAKHNIKKDPLMKFCVVTYPPRPALDVITDSKIEEKSKVIFEKIRSTEKPLLTALYIHIPFCTRLCTFCNFFLKAGKGVIDQIPSYLKLMEKEIKLLGNKTDNKIHVESIFFGGGTPSLLTPAQLGSIIVLIKEKFVVNDDIEITLEIHPEVVKQYSDIDQYLTDLRNVGINRISIGMQTVNNEILDSTKRGHENNESMKVFKAVKKAGFRTNIDLMCGFAEQTLESHYSTLETAFSLEPDHVTTYFLEIKPTSPEYTKYKERSDKNLDWEKNSKLELLNRLVAEAFGYEREDASYWRRKGSQSFVHIKRKWKLDTSVLLSIGPGTYNWIFNGFDNNFVFYKSFNIEKYEELLNKGIVPIERTVKMDANETVRRHLIFTSRNGKLPLERLKKWLDFVDGKTKKEIIRKIEGLKSIGLLKQTNTLLALTKTGWILDHEIAGIFAKKEHLLKASNVQNILEKKYDFFVEPKRLMKLQGIVENF